MACCGRSRKERKISPASRAPVWPTASSKVIGVLAFTALGFTLFGGVAGFLSGALGGAVAIGIRLFRNYGTVEHCVIRYDWRRIAISGIGAAAITLARR